MSEFDPYGARKGMFFEDIIEALIPPKFYYAEKVGFNDMHPEIAGVKYNDLLYDPKKENCWCQVRAGEGMTIWIIPK